MLMIIGVFVGVFLVCVYCFLVLCFGVWYMIDSWWYFTQAWREWSNSNGGFYSFSSPTCKSQAEEDGNARLGEHLELVERGSFLQAAHQALPKWKCLDLPCRLRNTHDKHPYSTNSRIGGQRRMSISIWCHSVIHLRISFKPKLSWNEWSCWGKSYHPVDASRSQLLSRLRRHRVPGRRVYVTRQARQLRVLASDWPLLLWQWSSVIEARLQLEDLVNEVLD